MHHSMVELTVFRPFRLFSSFGCNAGVPVGRLFDDDEYDDLFVGLLVTVINPVDGKMI